MLVEEYTRSTQCTSIYYLENIYLGLCLFVYILSLIYAYITLVLCSVHSRYMQTGTFPDAFYISLCNLLFLSGHMAIRAFIFYFVAVFSSYLYSQSAFAHLYTAKCRRLNPIYKHSYNTCTLPIPIWRVYGEICMYST